MSEEPEDKNYELSHIEVSPQVGSFRGRTMPAENKVFSVDFHLNGAIAEIESLRLLKEIYHWFGITDENIPYVDSESLPERIDRNRYQG